MLVKIKRIDLHQKVAPTLEDIWVNVDYVSLLKKLNDADVSAIRYSDFNLPREMLPLYEVSIKDEKVQIYTNEDGFLNLTKGNK